MAAQRQRAREAGKFAVDYNSIVKVEDETEFSGYDATEGQARLLPSIKMGL